MRFLLDENIHRGLLAFLSGLGHDATLSPKGLTNGKVLALAASEHRVLVTHDEDFATPVGHSPHRGIILVKIPPRRLELLQRSLNDLLAQRSHGDTFVGKLVVLFEDRWEEFPPS